MSLRTGVAVGIVLTVVSLTTFTSLAQQSGGEWAQWRGPDRTGVSQEKGLLKSWAPEGPKLAWRSEGLGYGHATPSIAGGRVFGMGLRGEDEVVWALNVADGKQVWSTRIAGAIRLGGGQGGYGPRSTPTVDGNRLYALGVGGELVCMEVATGKLLWHKNLVSDFGGSVPRWGYSESPLVDGEKVVATPGGRQATLIALNKMNGEVIWKAQVPEGDGAQYSSCIAADVGGQRQIIQFTHGGVIGIAAKDGKFLWKNNHAAFNTANCSTPIYRDNHVFAAAGYNKGGVLVKLTTNPDGVAATQVYHAPQMRNQHGGMILVGDHLYGFDDGVGLTCLNFKTGEIAWDNRSVGKGSLVYADGLLIARSERGPVALIEATPTGYVEKGRFTPPSDPNPSPEPQSRSTWPHPVIAGGRLYLRHMNILLCYELKS